MSDEEDVLAALEANGRAFLESFALSPAPATKKRSSEDASSSHSAKKLARKKRRLNEEEDVAPSVSSEPVPVPEEQMPNRKVPEVVVFSQPSSSKAQLPSKTLSRSFMSSKVSRITATINDIGQEISKPAEAEDAELERAQSNNDVELHRLLHTSLLSGSLNPELNMTPAQRRKALEGRVLELADRAKLGRGEKNVRDAEKKKATLRIREGMKFKQKERDAKELEEAKNVGNYHPALKKLFGSSAGDDTKPQAKRERGLAMGIGKHTSSGLRLSRDEIASVQGGPSSRGSDRGRRGGHGRGRGGSGRGRGKRR